MIVTQHHYLAWYEVMDREHMPHIDTTFLAYVMCRNGSRGEDSYSLRIKNMQA